ncbi:phage tail terminator protein [Methylobacter sp.]|uniref:phage tail terminator protein n=1 Tax=Methylobacter sp. TaxID=2051955 RepID=UPI003DA2C843
MINLLDLSLIVTELKTPNNCPSFGGRFFKTVPDDDLTIDEHESPVGFIYLADDDSDDNQAAGNRSVIQRTESHFMIELAIRRTLTKTDKFDDASVDLIRQYRTEIFTALIGKRLGACIKPIRHVNGKLKKKEARLIKWADIFTTDNIITG